VGRSVREAGQEARISEDSARKYLKIVFEKMGVRRQGELVAKVLNLPMPLSDFRR
jgi:DNA-binding CsgD family transcriptional regulator